MLWQKKPPPTEILKMNQGSINQEAYAASNLLVLDLIGTFVFALSGGTAGVRQRLELFGGSYCLQQRAPERSWRSYTFPASPLKINALKTTRAFSIRAFSIRVF
jgi:hypothetical protein